jgi:hypothetical protein
MTTRMAFARQVTDRLRLRESRAPIEFANGDTLGVILTRDLLAVEAAADDHMLTSILLLDGTKLRHGAAPNLPPSYCAAIDGSEIGPSAGSCGTAAFFGNRVFVTDIAQDPLWADYRHLALEHGLRACWSTPIFNDQGTVIGTFAIYHLMPRAPTSDEIDAIEAITEHVARAIMGSKGTANRSEQRSVGASRSKPALRLATEDGVRPNHRWQPDRASDPSEFLVAEIDQVSPGGRHPLFDIASDLEAISRAIERSIDALTAVDPEGPDVERLKRAKKATQDSAALARSALASNRLP